MHGRDRGSDIEALRPTETPREVVGCPRRRRLRGDRYVPDASPMTQTLLPDVPATQDGGRRLEERSREEQPDWDTSTSTLQRPQVAAQQSSHRAPPRRLQ